jgi:hypothetical protein
MSHVGPVAGARWMGRGRSPDAAAGARALVRADLWILLGLVLLVIAYRVLTTPMIETGGDAAWHWFYAKTWLAELAGGHIRDHHAARFSINSLTAAFQGLFGTHLIVYYLPAFSMSVAQVIFVYLLCRRATGVWAAVLASLLVILHPQMARNGAQLIPGIFCGTYVIACFYMLSRNFAPPQGRTQTNIVLAAVLLFCAYLSKETNLFFAPACLLAVWAARRSHKDVGLFMVVLTALGLLEYLYYALRVEGAWLGRLSTISGHLRGMSDPQNLSPDHFGLTWLNLPLRRYAPAGVGGIVPAVAFYTACASAIYLILRERRFDSTRGLVSYALLSYVLIDAYAVKGFDPLTPLQMFLDRYLAVLVPLISVVIVFAADDVGAAVSTLGQRTVALGWKCLLAPAVTTSLVAGFLYSFHDANQRRYVTDPARHPFVVLQRYQKVIDDARAQCVPFVVEPGKPRKIADRMFSDRFHRLEWEELKGSEFGALGFPDGCSSRYADLRAYVDTEGSNGTVGAVLVALRNPEGPTGLFVDRQRLPVGRLMPAG